MKNAKLFLAALIMAGSLIAGTTGVRADDENDISGQARAQESRKLKYAQE
jgi:hypothetical protein